MCCSIFLYDDIILIAPTNSGLQAWLAACEKESTDIDTCINAIKSKCIRCNQIFEVPCVDLFSTFGGSRLSNGLTAVAALVCSLSAVERLDEFGSS